MALMIHFPKGFWIRDPEKSLSSGRIAFEDAGFVKENAEDYIYEFSALAIKNEGLKDKLIVNRLRYRLYEGKTELRFDQ